MLAHDPVLSSLDAYLTPSRPLVTGTTTRKAKQFLDLLELAIQPEYVSSFARILAFAYKRGFDEADIISRELDISVEHYTAFEDTELHSAFTEEEEYHD